MSSRTMYRSRRLFCKSHLSLILSQLLSELNPLLLGFNSVFLSQVCVSFLSMHTTSEQSPLCSSFQNHNRFIWLWFCFYTSFFWASARIASVGSMLSLSAASLPKPANRTERLRVCFLRRPAAIFSSTVRARAYRATTAREILLRFMQKICETVLLVTLRNDL